MKLPHLIIVGAGASGLMAAASLASHFKITIIEAKDKPGGRILSIDHDNTVLEGGAEFIHGKLPITLRCLKAAGIEYEPAVGELYRKEDGKLKKERKALPGWNKLIRRMKKSPEDFSLLNFLDSEDVDSTLRQQIVKYAEGFDLADPARVSALSLAKEWAAEENNFRISKGYLSLLHHLLHISGATLITGQQVVRINWKRNDVSVLTNAGEKFQAEKILITVAPPLLDFSTPNGLVFEPALPEKIAAAKNIGYGAVIKILFQFKNRFWKKDAGFILSNEQYFPTWWPHGDASKNILTGWMGGPTALEIASISEEKITSVAIESLSSIFNISAEDLQSNLLFSRVLNWSNERSALGGYSYETVYSRIAKNVLNRPVANAIYFAGEALATGSHPGTVEAAFESGLQAAKEIKNDLLKNKQ